jgi:hypothetical protein
MNGHDGSPKRKGLRPEDRRLLQRLALGLLGLTLFVIFVVDALLGAPFYLALFVGLFLLCLDTITVTLVWAMYLQK